MNHIIHGQNLPSSTYRGNPSMDKPMKRMGTHLAPPTNSILLTTFVAINRSIANLILTLPK